MVDSGPSTVFRLQADVESFDVEQCKPRRFVTRSDVALPKGEGAAISEHYSRAERVKDEVNEGYRPWKMLLDSHLLRCVLLLD